MATEVKVADAGEEYGSEEDEETLKATYLKVLDEEKVEVSSEAKPDVGTDALLDSEVVEMDLKPTAAFQKWSGGALAPGEELDTTVYASRFESPLQKYQRLKREMSDFQTELEGISALAFEHSEEPTKDILTKVNEEIGSLWLNVEEFSKKPELAGLFAASGGGHGTRATVDAAYLFKKLKALSAASASETGAPATDSAVTFTLFHGAAATERKAVRLSELGQRMAQLESVVLGSSLPAADTATDTDMTVPGTYDAAGALVGTCDTRKGMAANVELLWRRLELLTDESRLSELQRRAEVLKKGLEEITFSTKEPVEDQITKAKEKKIDDMFDMLQRWDAMHAMEVLPKVVSRLSTLKALHSESAEVVSKVHSLATQQSLIKGTLTDSQALLKEVSQSLAQNATIMTDNMEAIEARIAALQTKFT